MKLNKQELESLIKDYEKDIEMEKFTLALFTEQGIGNTDIGKAKTRTVNALIFYKDFLVDVLGRHNG